MFVNDQRVMHGRGLYELFLVNPKDGTVLLRQLHVANSAESAKNKMLRSADWPDDADPDDFDILVTAIGPVRDKDEA